MAPKVDHTLADQTGIVIAGSAGQKIRSAARTFSQAGILAGLQATQKDDYPITIMTGHSMSEIILSPTKIEYAAIDSPDYFLVISGDGLKKTRAWISTLDDSCVLMIDTDLEPPETNARVIKLPLNEAAKDVGRLTIGIIALSALLQKNGLFPIDALRASIARFQKSTVAKASLSALDRGVMLAERSSATA